MAYGFKAKLLKFHVDKGKFTKTLDEKCLSLLKNGAREWLRAVYVRIPVYTGMARGSLKYAKGRAGPGTGMFLADFLRVSIPINPIAIRKGKDALKGGRQARFTLSGSKGHYNFTFNQSVIHYILNEFPEYQHAGPSWTHPWESFAAGKAAFDSYLASNRHKLMPKVSEFVTISEVWI